MSHPSYYPTQVFSYAIGNTPPICLTDHLPPEEPAHILLLGCGDPRHILYTISVDPGVGNRHFDVTCCDWEVVTLARNTILLTLISDTQGADNRLWNIFYHIYLDKSSLDLLSEQCRKLIALSSDLDSWNSSLYARFLRFCSSQTLASLRRQWEQFLGISTQTPAELARFKKKFDAEWLAARGENYLHTTTGVRNAGPMFAAAMPSVRKHFSYYWENGVIEADKQSLSRTVFPNPTLSYSTLGVGFSLHYGTDPILGFHLAPVFIPSKLDKGTQSDDSVGLGLCAKAQFQQWCKSFHQAVVSDDRGDSSPRIVIRIQVGETLAFCHALRLQSKGIEGPFMSLWGGERIILDDESYQPSSAVETRAPTMFNTIDTSNLTDHLGLVNILISASPCLSLNPWSTIITATLLKAEGASYKPLESRIFSDIHAFSLLLGVIPESCDTMFTSRSNIHEIAMSTLAESAQYHEPLSWKRLLSEVRQDPASCRIGFDARELSRLLFHIYLSMFHGENLHDMMTTTLESTASALKLLRALALNHYIRRSFALFVRIVMDRVATNWLETVNGLLDFITQDRSLVTGMNNYQDLCCQLHLLGVYTLPPCAEPELPFMWQHPSCGRLRGWSLIPSIICVTLVVPRHSLVSLTELSHKEIGSPLLEASIYQSDNHHAVFSDIQIMFGACYTIGPDHNPTIIVEEDPAGWRGSSPLAVTFWAPSWIFQRPVRTTVCLGLNNNPQNARNFVPKLGISLWLFKADSEDMKSVRFSRERPQYPDELSSLSRLYPREDIPMSTTGNTQLNITLDDGARKPGLMKIRISITEEKAIASLQMGSDISVNQVSPCLVKISFKNFLRNIAFPLAIDGRYLKTRIARKSLYIEVHAPPSNFKDPLSRFTDLSPQLTGTFPILPCISRVKLKSMPIVDTTSDSKKLKELLLHVCFAMSDREMSQSISSTKPPANDLFLVKKSIALMIYSVCAMDMERSVVFGLSLSRELAPHTMFFVQDMRLDLASNTIVLDACVLTLRDTVLSNIPHCVNAVMGKGIRMIFTPPAEMHAWKNLIPTFAERCRIWSHSPNCEYLQKDAIPRSFKADEDPLCSCGQGKDLGPFTKTHAQPKLAPYVTRIAISQLFALSYLEPVGKRISNVFKAQPNSFCAICYGPGKPKLLFCGKCREVRYCSVECQKKAWGVHKKNCKK